MEYGRDSEPNADVRFISSHISIFAPEENSFPASDCSLVAAAPKFGRIFVACGTQIKVFDSKTLGDGLSDSPLTTLSVGAQVTHVAVSCDGLTLLVTLLHDQQPHALFYEIRAFVAGCGEQMPLVSVALTEVGGQVHALSWNPTDPGSVAVALSPSSLTLLTLKDNRVESKSENVEARALGWSPKGKQLTVGLADGTLKLFKPDLTAVRSIQRPPMNEVGAVLSVTWFTNTEFFVGYKSSVEEGVHVIMYVSAPKAKEPKFVAYEYICNYNQGPRKPLFYPMYFPEWSLLCLLSSRAVTVAVLGRPSDGVEGWCEYEIDEGYVAAVHNVSITQETFPLGLAVDFTSQKTFTAKDNKVSGPCPVLCTLSTGGELNLFHIINEKSGAEPLTKLPENLPTTGFRTPQQFGGAVSYSVNKAAVSSVLTSSSAPQTAVPAAHVPFAPSPSSAPQQKVDTFSFNPPAQAPSLFSASPLQNLSANFMLPQTASSPMTGLFQKTEPSSTSFLNMQGPSEGAKPAPAAPASTPKLPQSTTTSQDFKFPTFAVHQLTTPAVASTSVITAAVPKPPEVKPQSVAPLPRPPQAVVAELDETLLSTIDMARTNFERELEDHTNMGDLPNQIGGQEEMGGLRCSLGEAAEWMDQMNSTTSELKGEVGQLHSEVLEGFTLAEEAEAKVNKSKNPRHRLVLQPQTLDPHSRKQMEEIRSLYQYLQSQLAEIDMRLHLDWATFRNEQNKKKKKELPASETLYQALKKCHYARKVCERRVDALCERIKDLHLQSLSGLATSQTHQEDDEILVSLEKSLRETSISAPPLTSPFKMLSPVKQESLQKVLSQRNFIPLRKCSKLPRMDLSSLENLSRGHSQQGSPHSSFTPNAGHSLLESFGPQTSSTPIRKHQTPSQVRDISKASFTQENEAVSAAAGHPEPQYEDITPPQTPDSRLAHGTKPASPLRALSRLVSEVPTTGASESKVPGVSLLPEGKTSFRGFGDGGSSPGALKVPVTVPSGPFMGAFKPVTSAPLSKTTVAFSFTQFVPPNTASQSSGTQQSKSQSVAGGSVLFEPRTTALDNTCYSQAGSSEVSQKTEANGGLFFKPPVSISESHAQFSDQLETSVAPVGKLPNRPAASTSQVQSVSEAAGSTLALGPMSVPQAFTSTPLPASAAETDSTSSSSSADSDTASNATVIEDNASIFGVSDFPEGSEAPTERVGNTAISHGLVRLIPADSFIQQSGSSSSSLMPPSSTSQPNQFSATSGSLFGSSSGSMFGGSSSTTSGFFGTKTSADSGNLHVSSATTAATTTLTTTTTTSASLFVTPTTIPGSFFTAATTAALGSVFIASTTAAGSLFGVQPTTPSNKGLSGIGTTATTTTTVATMTSGSLFGNATTTKTILGTTATTTGSILGTTKSTSGGTTFETAATSGGSIFGATTTASGSIFGTVATNSGSIFGTTVTTSGTGSILGAAIATTTASVFGDAATPANNVGTFSTTTAAPDSVTVATTVEAATGSDFGVSPTITSSTLGSSTTAAATTSSGSIFGVTDTTSGGILGATSTASGNIFGTANATATGSIFGTPLTSTGSGSIFGPAATNTTGGIIFGIPAKTGAATPSIFGSSASNMGNTSNLFGGASNTVASATSINTITSTASTPISVSSSPSPLTTGLFSSPPAGVSPSFNLSFAQGGGSGSTPTTSTTPTLFSTQATTSATGVSFSAGGILSASSTTSSAFTSLATSGSAFTSPGSSSAPSLTSSTIAMPTTASTVFGQSSQSTPGLMFGATASPQGSLFGGGGSQSNGGFGTSAPAGGIFGGSGGQSVFGNTSGSIFGQTSAASVPSPFSVSTSKAEASPFGGSSVFGSGGGGGGGFFSGLGSKPSEENASKNVFGTASLSNAAPQTSLFGNSSTSPFQSSVFGGSSTSSSTGTGTFSGDGGGGPVANTGFAVSSPQSAPAFGSTATFGGSPSFGGSPTFGSPPRLASQGSVFGGSSTFSSPLSSSTGGGFSSFASSGGATFGSIAGPSSPGTTTGFGSFANQPNTTTFGGLAQQSSNQPNSGAFGSGTGTTFGSGSSFSAWR